MKRILIIIVGLLIAVPFVIANVNPSPKFAPMDPPTETQDQAIQNIGNLWTSVNNWGKVGGYYYLNIPDGEWPGGSGHHHLAEIAYWMGARVTEDSVVVVNTTADDFAPLPDEMGSYKIHIWTDPSSFNYNPDDTVGAWANKPAYGWRVFDAATQQWTFNRIWDPLSQTYKSGGPVSLQDSYYRFADNNQGDAFAMGLNMSHTAYQWNYNYNKDYIFFVLEITNISGRDYEDFAFGLYCDMDIGGPDATGENGRLGDLVAFDSTRNLAWTYDEDGFDAGWGPLVKTGFLGTRYIETPDNIGMTAFRTGQWENLPSLDEEMYPYMDAKLFEQSLPPTDQYYVMCTRGISMPAGKTVRIVYALIAGQTETILKANSDLAQNVYDNNFVGPEPPIPPKLTAVEGDKSITLYWDDGAEKTIDPFSGEADFVGYRVYRSTDLGQTWGDLTVNDDGSLGPEYQSLATYAQPPYPHKFVDNNVINGFEYWYAVTAFDAGIQDSAGNTILAPLENDVSTAKPGLVPYAASVIPRSNALGAAGGKVAVYDSIVVEGHDPEYLYINHVSGGSDGIVDIEVLNPEKVKDVTYQVKFNDLTLTDPDGNEYIETVWSLYNKKSGQIVVAENGLRLENMPQTSDDSAPVFDGCRIIVSGPDYGVKAVAQVCSNGNLDNVYYSLNCPDAREGCTWYIDEGSGGTDINRFNWNGVDTRDWEIRVSSAETNYCWDWFANYEDYCPTPFPAMVAFEFWDIGINTPNNPADDRRTSFMLIDDDVSGTFTWGDGLYVWDIDYDDVDWESGATPCDYDPDGIHLAIGRIWFTLYDGDCPYPKPGTVIRILTNKPNSTEDVFEFSTKALLKNNVKESDLKNIAVVPNPYIAHADWETKVGLRKLQFIHLPDKCTIRIYTLSGDLVNTIEHTNGTGTEDWNMQSFNKQEIVPGIYFYHIESDYGEIIGKFGVIK